MTKTIGMSGFRKLQTAEFFKLNANNLWEVSEEGVQGAHKFDLTKIDTGYWLNFNSCRSQINIISALQTRCLPDSKFEVPDEN